MVERHSQIVECPENEQQLSEKGGGGRGNAKRTMENQEKREWKVSRMEKRSTSNGMESVSDGERARFARDLPRVNTYIHREVNRKSTFAISNNIYLQKIALLFYI